MNFHSESKPLAETWDGPHVTAANPEFDFESALLATALRQHQDDVNGDVDDHLFNPDLFSLSPLTTPGSTPPSSPVLAPEVTLVADLNETSLSHVGSTSTKLKPKPKDRKERRKTNSRALRQKKRENAQAATYGYYVVREVVKQRYINGTDPIVCDVDIETFPVTSTGYTGINDGSRPRKIHRLEDVVGENSKHKFRLVKWNGSDVIPICNRTRRLVALLAGHPRDADWPAVHRTAAQALEERQRRCAIPKGKRKHRRGAFTALSTGVSHGSGQTEPKNLSNPGENGKVLQELTSMECFRRIAGFSSACMASWAPDLYSHYSNHLGKLHQDNPNLHRLWTNSVFSAATYNFGPCTVTFQHRDFANLACGWCPVTALGPFDPTKGGHMILWDLGLVIEFPPGSTILLPSAVVAHSNVAIAKEERRYSFAQYSAGALFRWVDNDNQTAGDYYALLSPEKLTEMKAENEVRRKTRVSLFPKLKKKGYEAI